MNKKIGATYMIFIFILILTISGCSSQSIKRITEMTKNGEFTYSFPENYKKTESSDQEWDLAMGDTKNNRTFYLFFYSWEAIDGYSKEDILDFHVREMSSKANMEMIKEISEKDLIIKVFKNTQDNILLASFLSVMEVDKGYLFSLQTCPFEDMDKGEPEFLEIVKSVKESDADEK